jgi:hypothetical protein
MVDTMPQRASLASQNTLSDMTSKFGGRTPVRIYFLDNSSKIFLLEPSTSCLEVIRMILEKFDVKNIETSSPYFALYESVNGTTIDTALNLDDRISSTIQKWKESDASKLVFMIRLNLPSIWGFQHKDVVATRFGKVSDSFSLQSHLESSEIIDSQLINFQYNQAVYNVITGQYPTSHELALELGAYHFLHKFSSFNESRHDVGFLGNRIVEFIPYVHLRGTDIEEWESKLISTLRDMNSIQSGHPNKRNLDPQRRYLETVLTRQTSYFGCAFFRVAQVCTLFI